MTPFERGGFASTPVEGVDGGQAPWRRFALAEKSCISAYTHSLEQKDVEQEVRGVGGRAFPSASRVATVNTLRRQEGSQTSR